ncbi:MAG TPA: YkgJ family cysteine cluster protein [Methylophilaceae bacterium]|nr:YkgJ family cysteine cluster protein [Methylophilaceae bacterium]HQR60977.1 YkgJ family cysteine cluster protein [Methylophilaceae bacterium]
MNTNSLICRPNCGACCIAPSINSPIPGMPNGKLAGVRCIHLAEDYRCALFGLQERPAFCVGLKPAVEMCGETRAQALTWLTRLEQATTPEI